MNNPTGRRRRTTASPRTEWLAAPWLDFPVPTRPRQGGGAGTTKSGSSVTAVTFFSILVS